MSATRFEVEANGQVFNIFRDNSIAPGDDYRYFLHKYPSGGVSCWTVWFSSLAAARRAFIKDGIRIGTSFADCEKCACHVFNKNKRMHICSKAKHEYAVSFEKMGNGHGWPNHVK